MKITRNLSPDGGTGGTAPTGLENSLFDTFASFKAPEPDAAKADAAEAAKGGADSVLAAEQAKLETLLAKDVASLTAEEKTSLEALKLKFNVEELNEDGTPVTKEQKDAIVATQAKLAAILAKKEEDRTQEEIDFLNENTEEELSLYDQVDEIIGKKVEIDYGTIDPKSAQGIAKREEYIRDQAAREYDEEIKQEFPIAYNLMLHLKAGGDVRSFLDEGGDEDYQAVSITKGDVKAQEAFYRKALRLKGNDADEVDALVTYAKDKGKLFERSTAELEALQAKQDKDNEQKQLAIKQAEQRDVKLSSAFWSAVDTSLTSGIKGVNIPKTDHKEFREFIKNSIFNQNGKLVFLREINGNNLQDELAASYFRFKKGDLATIAQRKAATLKAQEIKNKVFKYKITPKNSPDAPKGFVGMSQI
jgi:hypothetical protein